MQVSAPVIDREVLPCYSGRVLGDLCIHGVVAEVELVPVFAVD